MFTAANVNRKHGTWNKSGSFIVSWPNPGTRFTNGFLPANQIRWKLRLAITPLPARHEIATIFCTCHDSTAVVPCTKFGSDHCIRIEVRVKRNLHRIWIAMENPLVKRDPAPTLFINKYNEKTQWFIDTFKFIRLYTQLSTWTSCVLWHTIASTTILIIGRSDLHKHFRKEAIYETLLRYWKWI